MTVKELRDMLATAPDDMTVVTDGYMGIGDVEAECCGVRQVGESRVFGVGYSMVGEKAE